MPFRQAGPDYVALLDLFPEDAQGFGRDPSFGTAADQPMTYGLVLMAETRHQLAGPTEEGRRRVRKGAEWLMANADLDGDGRPGWGLPDAFDAFGDGSVNPPDQPYTITTAIALDGLIDASRVPLLWTDRERRRLGDLALAVLQRWANEAFTPLPDGGGFFWYSTATADAKFAVNPSAMLAGTTRRFLHQYGAGLPIADRRLLTGAADRAARSIVGAVEPRAGRPYWTYAVVPSRVLEQPNDAVHHAYIIWGMEDYRRYGGAVRLSWTPTQARASLRTFISAGAIAEYPQDVLYDSPLYRDRPARLWGTGMLMAAMARLGDRQGAEMTYRSVETGYGPPPRFRLWPATYSADSAFYPRMAAHLLLGLAEHDFGGAVR